MRVPGKDQRVSGRRNETGGTTTQPVGTTSPTVSGTVTSQSQVTFTPAVPTTVLYQAGLGTVTTPYVLPTTVPSIKAEVDKITAPKKKIVKN